MKVDDLEEAVERLIAALEIERAKAKNLGITVAEHNARWERGPEELESLRRENAKLRRNASVAAEKIEELLKRLGE